MKKVANATARAGLFLAGRNFDLAIAPGVLVYRANWAVGVNFDHGAVKSAQQPAPSSPLANVDAGVTATIGGVDTRVLFAGTAPNFVGLTQVNLVGARGV